MSVVFFRDLRLIRRSVERGRIVIDILARN